MALQLLANIDVDDLEKATEFYCGAQGLRVGRRLGWSVIELLGASAAIYLIKKPAGMRTSSGFRAAHLDKPTDPLFYF
jgi:extradiol dioxygenase family protein